MEVDGDTVHRLRLQPHLTAIIVLSVQLEVGDQNALVQIDSLDIEAIKTHA